MKRNTTAIILTATLVLSIALLIVSDGNNFTLADGSSRTIVVPDDFSTIQKAIANASAGDTVYVKIGAYSCTSSSPIVVNKTLTLIGENPLNTIITGEWSALVDSPPVIRVTANNVTITGFTLFHSNTAGVWLENATKSASPPSGCQIVNNVITGNTVGIQAYGGSNLNISNNQITNNLGFGIYDRTSNSVISQNTIQGNRWAGIILNSCTNVVITGNSITANGGGNLSSAFNGGVLLRWDGAFTVYHNDIKNNIGPGVLFGEACNVSPIYENNIENNTIGVELLNYQLLGETAGMQNSVYHNNFINNLQQAFASNKVESGTPIGDNATVMVSWDNGVEGNYWSDYLSNYPDAFTANGITLSEPYIIDVKNQDNFPMLNPISFAVTTSPSPTPGPSDSPGPSSSPNATNQPASSTEPSTSPSPTSTSEPTPTKTPTTHTTPHATKAHTAKNNGFWTTQTIAIVVSVVAVMLVVPAGIYALQGRRGKPLDRDYPSYKPEPSPYSRGQDPPPYSSPSSSLSRGQSTYQSPQSARPRSTSSYSTSRYSSPTTTSQYSSSRYSSRYSSSQRISAPSASTRSTGSSSYSRPSVYSKTCPHCKRGVTEDRNICPYCYKRIK